MNSPTRYSAEVRVQSTLAPTVTTLNEGRSLNSGDTRARTPPRCAGTPALNEGRSLNSGDTRHRARLAPIVSPAQRRPESELRRHGRKHDRKAGIGARSTKAGV